MQKKNQVLILSMRKPIVFTFSGQGSQYFQMGKELYDNHPRFKVWMDHCNDIVSSYLGTSLIHIIYQPGVDRSDLFDNILHTTPALLSIEYSLTQLLIELKIKPDFLLGYSMGEFTASIVSGAVSLEQGLEFAIKYARLVQKRAEPAGMLAIIESVDIMNQLPEVFRNCWLTGNNFNGNFVVSGRLKELLKLESELKERNIISQKLPVNYAFHTKLMDPLEDDFKQLARAINFGQIRIPIVSSQTGIGVQEVTEEYLWNVTRYPVEFEKTIRLMARKKDYIFIDVGPGGSLSTFVKYILSSDDDSIHLEVINQFGRDLKSLDKLKAVLFA